MTVLLKVVVLPPGPVELYIWPYIYNFMNERASRAAQKHAYMRRPPVIKTVSTIVFLITLPSGTASPIL